MLLIKSRGRHLCLWQRYALRTSQHNPFHKSDENDILHIAYIELNYISLMKLILLLNYSDIHGDASVGGNKTTYRFPVFSDRLY